MRVVTTVVYVGLALCAAAGAPATIPTELSLEDTSPGSRSGPASASRRLLLGEYPEFSAPVYRPPSSSCDVTAAPWSAAGDGQTDDTAALQKCIEGCPRDPSGAFAVVLKASKRFLTGALNLTSGCHLIIDGVLLGSTDPARYPVIPPLAGYGESRDPAVHRWGRHQALLSGWHMTDVVVAGSGKIDGQGNVSNAQSGTSWQGRFWTHYQCEKAGCSGKPADTLLEFGRPHIWEPMFSQRLTLANVTVANQPFWAVHPYLLRKSMRHSDPAIHP